MDFWTVMVFLHLVAMAFFLGGQMMLAGTVVPVLRKSPDPEEMRGIARRFGAGSAIAIGVALLTGMLMASHYKLWDYGPFQVKMTLPARPHEIPEGPRPDGPDLRAHAGHGVVRREFVPLKRHRSSDHLRAKRLRVDPRRPQPGN